MSEMRRLGKSGPYVSAMGLGCFGMSGAYGAADRQEAMATIHRAVELGYSLLDTADVYGGGNNEILVGEAIRTFRQQIVLSTKVGFVWDREGRVVARDGTPAHIRQACDESLRRLGTDVIDVYYLHRVDPNVPVEESFGAMADLVRAGKVRYLGLSELDAEGIRRAHRVHPVTALQSEFSLWSRSPEWEVLPTCRELGIGLVAFSPLGRGFLAGALLHSELSANDFRNALPRFQSSNLDRNRAILKPVLEAAANRHCTTAQVALAWVLSRGNDIIAIPGAKRRTHLEENWQALDITLSDAEKQLLEEAFAEEQLAGNRYPENSIFHPN
jgi:aryl-alcohol dehydrogenase-like predicted oxidoreductase